VIWPPPMHQRGLKTRLESPDSKRWWSVTLVLTAVALAASYIQAMRATAIIARFFEIKAEDLP
jgi:hypothetical protein